MTRPALVPVRLRELRLSEEFETGVTHQHGRVIDWGYTVYEDYTGRRTRVRTVLCAYGALQRRHSAEMLVLVAYDRPHSRKRKDDEGRWEAPLDRPATTSHADDLATHGAVAGRRVRANSAESAC